MNNEVFIIAEIGQAHEGSLGIAHSYIDAISSTGVNAIKWQTHIADAESSLHEKFRVKFSYEDDTRIDYWKRMEFTKEQWRGLKDHCEEKGLEFISSPFSLAAVALLEEIGVKRYKIGSGEVNNLLLLSKIASTGKPIIISSGMSSYQELDDTVTFLQGHNSKISLLQCTTAYPTSPEEWGLNVIRELKNRYDVPVGFSDHSGDIYACLAAATLGAEILEFHVVFDKRMFGPDSKSSITIEQTSQLVTGVREICQANASPVNKEENSQFKHLKNIFEKSLAVNTSLKKGDIIKQENLEAKKPKGMGINADKFKLVVGQRVTRDLEKWDFITDEDVDG